MEGVIMAVIPVERIGQALQESNNNLQYMYLKILKGNVQGKLQEFKRLSTRISRLRTVFIDRMLKDPTIDTSRLRTLVMRFDGVPSVDPDCAPGKWSWRGVGVSNGRWEAPRRAQEVVGGAKTTKTANELLAGAVGGH